MIMLIWRLRVYSLVLMIFWFRFSNTSTSGTGVGAGSNSDVVLVGSSGCFVSGAVVPTLMVPECWGLASLKNVWRPS